MPRRFRHVLLWGLALAVSVAGAQEEKLSRDALFGPNTRFNYFAQANRLQAEPSEKATLANAAMLAQCSLLAYVDDRRFVENALARALLGQTQYFDRAGTYAFLAEGPEDLVLAFRGTETSDTADLLTDAKVGFSQYAELGMAHSGFVAALALVNDEIAQAIDERQAKHPKRLWVTGHSLGGALATLWALPRRDETQGVFTFGAPRLVAGRLAKDAAAWLPLYRFVNDNDMIPRLPPPNRYRHIGPTHFIDCYGALIIDPPELKKFERRFHGHQLFAMRLLREHWSEADFTAIPSDYIVDHSPLRYAELLIALAQPSHNASAPKYNEE